jgi:hypothetical protein
MLLAIALAGALAAVPTDTLPVQPPIIGTVEQPVGIGAPPAAPVALLAPVPADTPDTNPTRRRKAIEISDAYATRLKIHYIASFAMIPIFTAQAIVGSQLYHAENNGNLPAAGLRNTHAAIAYTLGALFVTNGITGSMNWWETRHQEKGLAWRTVHASLMLLAEGGFAYTASLGTKAGPFKGGGNPARDLHRSWAEASAGVALASYIMMWKPIRGDK